MGQRFQAKFYKKFNRSKSLILIVLADRKVHKQATGGMTNEAIARATGLPVWSVNKLTARYANYGLVRRHPCATNKKGLAYSISITKRGLNYVSNSMPPDWKASCVKEILAAR